jgi:hypothetical protein
MVVMSRNVPFDRAHDKHDPPTLVAIPLSLDRCSVEQRQQLALVWRDDTEGLMPELETI